MVASVLPMLIVELLDSAIAAAVDRISLDFHRLAKRAKDIGSAAVLLALLNVCAVWTRCCSASDLARHRPAIRYGEETCPRSGIPGLQS